MGSPGRRTGPICASSSPVGNGIHLGPGEHLVGLRWLIEAMAKLRLGLGLAGLSACALALGDHGHRLGLIPLGTHVGLEVLSFEPVATELVILVPWTVAAAHKALR